MRKISAMYHEKMFYFWYGKNTAMRDYHGKKYHQILSLPVSCVDCGIRFKSLRRELVLIAQCVAVVAVFVLTMLALVSQFA